MSGGESYNQKNNISRSKALGVMALMLALFIFQVTVFIVNAVKERNYKHNPSLTDVENNTPSTYNKAATQQSERFHEKRSKQLYRAERFEFDPNTISLDSLCRLGFSPKQAQTILNYRNKGGVFRKREDFAKMYVVNDSLYNELSKYIVIAQKSTRKYTQEDKIPTVGNSIDSIPKSEKKQYKPLLIELNSADSTQLVKLYGIGGYYANRIVAYRERVGKFYTPEQLMEIEGIDSLRYSHFAKNIKADPAAVRRFRLDTAGKSFLIRHPYIGAYAARGIILLREKFGTAACTLQNLVKEKILSPAMAEKLWYYIVE